jgi:putative ABC transport system substrate-binding protein
MAGGLLATSLAAEGQSAKKVYRIGYLGAGSPVSSKRYLEKFVEGLIDLGYVEGRDFVMEYRWAEGHQDRLAGLAAELVRARVDVIVHGRHNADVCGDAGDQDHPDRLWERR